MLSSNDSITKSRLDEPLVLRGGRFEASDHPAERVEVLLRLVQSALRALPILRGGGRGLGLGLRALPSLLGLGLSPGLGKRRHDLLLHHHFSLLVPASALDAVGDKESDYNPVFRQLSGPKESGRLYQKGSRGIS